MQENIDDIIKEMRQIRPGCDDCISNHVCDYLSSFADRIEAVCKRYEKKYEYTAVYIQRKSGKIISKCAYHFNSFDVAKRFKYYPQKYEKLRFVRRAVGEWEEVAE